MLLDTMMMTLYWSALIAPFEHNIIAAVPRIVAWHVNLWRCLRKFIDLTEVETRSQGGVCRPYNGVDILSIEIRTHPDHSPNGRAELVLGCMLND